MEGKEKQKTEWEEKEIEKLKSTIEGREGALKELKQMIDRYTQLHTQLRRQERTLQIQANQHMKSMRAMEAQIKSIHDYLTRCKEMHAKMLTSITQPSWAISHHYHMTSIEHTMGHTQPHILEVGDMIRGHLHIYAMANCTTQYRRQAELHLRKANADRSKAADKIKQVYAKLRKVRACIINTLKVLNTATKTVPAKSLDIGKASNKPVDKRKSAGQARTAGMNRNRYLAVKMRYLSSLNIDHNVELTSSLAQADKDGKADDMGEVAVEQETNFASDLESLHKLLTKYTNLTLDKRRIERKLINKGVQYDLSSPPLPAKSGVEVSIKGSVASAQSAGEQTSEELLDVAAALERERLSASPKDTGREFSPGNPEPSGNLGDSDAAAVSLVSTPSENNAKDDAEPSR
eukprot:CAMPEP_0184490104 /NCGR_PEP_ID=MMETSP0113_2-20130426/17173_1 /TAXON_ID=91329 /ORGANISM="Norrisiella sphaerica, Strain BC52" /LENGTH=404 /DNA_ID=CAMNT_0026873861 /DNA_START=129 /DNA_END=1343 /DNA_ORIENTATION=+